MQISAERLSELKQSFDYNDLDQDGAIGLAEFVSMLSELDAQTSFDEAKLGFEAIDINNDGSIQFEEFVEWWVGR